MNNDVAEPRRGKSTPLQSKDLLQSKDIYKGIDLSPFPEGIRPAVREYLTHRRAIKKPLKTKQALTRLRNRLESCKAEGIDPEQALAVTIDRGWSDVNIEWLKNALPKQGENRADCF